MLKFSQTNKQHRHPSISIATKKLGNSTMESQARNNTLGAVAKRQFVVAKGILRRLYDGNSSVVIGDVTNIVSDDNDAVAKAFATTKT